MPRRELSACDPFPLRGPAAASIPPPPLPAPAALPAASPSEARAREVISSAGSERVLTLKVTAFSCFSARVSVPARRVLTYANREGTPVIPVQRTDAHVCIQRPRTLGFLPRRSCGSLALRVPSVTELVAPGEQQAGEHPSPRPGAWARPQPVAFSAEGFREGGEMLPRFGAGWAVRFTGCLYYLSARYRLVLNKEDATFEEWIFFFLFVS